MKIGIQGNEGSTNETACRFFAKKHGWRDFEIKYLITSENVLKALNNGEIDYGTFAWATSNGGHVAETKEAAKKYKFEKVDEHDFFPDHALLSNSEIDAAKTIHVFSHPQALAAHEDFLRSEFENVRLHEEIDTAVVAQYLSEGKYPKNSIVIAPADCAQIYGLKIFSSDLPANKGYKTTIFLVKKPL